MDPEIRHGKPCIRGLRYPVENVLAWLASGMSIEDILAALSYAAQMPHIQRRYDEYQCNKTGT